MTDLQPLTIVSRNHRKKRLFSIENKKLQSCFVGHREWMLDDLHYKMNNYNENQIVNNEITQSKYQEYWNKINQLNGFQKRVFRYKFNYYFEKIRNNKQVSELMVCSEETIRKTISDVIHKIIYKSLSA